MTKRRQLLIARLWLHLLIVVIGLLLTFFSNPNRLAHDQIYHRIFRLIHHDPQLFADDYLFGSPKRILMDSYFSYEALGALADRVGSEEVVRWLLVPLAFIIFTAGFFELNYQASKRLTVSFGLALAANWHIPNVFTAEWGLPGPSELDPWVFFQAMTPTLVLWLYAGSQRQRWGLVALAFAVAGLLGNVHIISAFYFVGIAAITCCINSFASARSFSRTGHSPRPRPWGFTTPLEPLAERFPAAELRGMGQINRGFRVRTVAFCAAAGVLAGLASLPFLLKHYAPDIVHHTAFNPGDREIRAAIDAAAYHVTLPGRLANAKPWLVTHWYTIWPLAALFLWGYRRQTRHLGQPPPPFLRFASHWIIATIIFNIGFSLIQIFRLVGLHQLPFWNEPRGFQLVYFGLIPSAAIIIGELLERAAQRVNRHRLAAATAVLALAAATALGTRFAWLQQRYRAHITPRYSFATCDAKVYRFLNGTPLPPGPILIDPDAWSAFRICTKRGVVVQGRDRAFAYSLGSDVLRDWSRRYQAATGAFAAGHNALMAVAKQYGARVIVSKRCVPVDEANRVERHVVQGEACVYVLDENP